MRETFKPLEACLSCSSTTLSTKTGRGSNSFCLACREAIRLCACGCGRKVSGAYRTKDGCVLRLYVKGHHRLGQKMSKVQKRRVSIGHRKWIENTPKEVRELWAANVKQAMLKMWKTRPDLKENLAKRLTIQAVPNKAEMKLASILQRFFPGEFQMNVKDGKVIGGKVPDFIRTDKKRILVEMFGTYWHSQKITGRTPEQEELFRVTEFKKHGFQTAIVWEKDLKNEEMVRDKVLQVMSSK